MLLGPANLKKRTAGFGTNLPPEKDQGSKEHLRDHSRRVFSADQALFRALPSREGQVEEGLSVALTQQDKVLLSAAVRLVGKAESLRRRSGMISSDWQRVCRIRSDLPQHRAPRWTFPVFYFRKPIAARLAGMDGLDIGARTPEPTDAPRGLRSIVPVGRAADDLSEWSVPHFRYYEGLGCRMRAIDLVTCETRSGIDQGDARLLQYADASLDFITVPMLLGPPHACASPLEIAFCLGEFRRVLRPGGFAFIADAGVQPSVLFAAQLFHFSTSLSKGHTDGLPVGTLLRRTGRHTAPGNCHIFSSLGLAELRLARHGPQVVVGANLLWNSEMPRVTSARKRTNSRPAPSSESQRKHEGRHGAYTERKGVAH